MLAAVDGEYSYAIPPELAGQVEPGRRVLVPFGRARSPQPAFCVAVGQEAWTNTLRPVAEVLDDQRLLGDQLLELGRWMARYYCCPLGRTLAAMVPEAVRSQSGFRSVKRLRITDKAPASPEVSHPAAERTLSPKRRAVLDALSASPEGLDLDELIERSGATRDIIAAMVKAGLLTVETRLEAAAAPDFDEPGEEPVFALTPEQSQAIQRIEALMETRQFRAVLLFGVSGSGKTEVYIRAIRSALARGRQAILLVPEIALTTQVVHRLASRFRDVAVIHSGLTGVQRSLTWAAIARGDKKVVIGTRSAVFAPCPDLGVVVVDEEQEGSYKNQQAPRFHTRDVAIRRAQMAGVPVVLGSATPALETWHNCERLPHFERVTLHNRIAGLPMPGVEFVNMQVEQQERRGVHLLSRPMEEGLRRTLADGRQAVLLLNRRGYASYLVCSRCRTPIVCPNCRSNMVFHQTTGKAKCHHCSSRMVVPVRCGDPGCGGTLIRFGMGTQRVEEELRVKFPDARIARADSDALTKVEQYEQIVGEFEARRIDVLIGTQMVAKGLDFPYVSFVGVINADIGRSTPDFRADERTFQMITQVAGRAGRATAGGSVIVQSLEEPTPTLRRAGKHDYEGFVQEQLPLRKKFGWPPFSRLARVIVSAATDSEAQGEARRLATAIRDHITTHALKADVLGPQSAPLARMRNRYRYDFLVRSPDASRLLETMERLRQDKVLTPNTPLALVDVDPVSLL